MKRISIISLLLALSLVFVGCSAEEANLAKALVKTQNAISMESTEELAITLEVENLDKQPQELQEMVNMLNGAKFTTQQRMAGNKEKTRVRTDGVMSVDLGGLQMNMEVWINAVMDGENPEMLEVIKVPKLLMGQIVPEAAGKEYLVYDIGALMMEEEDIDFKALIADNQKINREIIKLINEHYADFDLGMKAVESKGKKIIDGESLSIYEIKLNDKTFKELLRNSGDQLLNYRLLAGLLGNGFDAAFLKRDFSLGMDKLDQVKVLGDRGITLQYGVNDKGFIVHQTSSIDLNIDASGIEKAFNPKGNTILPGVPKVKLGLRSTTKSYNINEDIQITLPTVDENNAVYFNDLLKELE